MVLDHLHYIKSIPVAVYGGMLENITDRPSFKQYFLMVGLINLVVYWGVSFFFLFLDRTGYMSKWKFQPGMNEPLAMERWWKVFRQVLFNQLVNNSLVTCTTWFIRDFSTNNDAFSMETMPTLQTALCHFLVFVVVEEICFYHFHRLCHEVPFLYKHIHKTHHEWKAPIAASGRYSHVLEDLFVNLLPVMLGPWICNSHQSLVIVWVIIAQISTMLTHSGYSFCSIPRHDRHHQYQNVNYGVMLWCDLIYGTEYKGDGRKKEK